MFYRIIEHCEGWNNKVHSRALVGCALPTTSGAHLLGQISARYKYIIKEVASLGLAFQLKIPVTC